jgi:hypothetical protein
MKYVLRGRIATMDATATLFQTGAVYVDGNSIAAVNDSSAPAPVDFSGAATLQTSGIIFPGLIELHNHLSYNVLPMWLVPKKFSDRSQWQNSSDYRHRVTDPMGTIAQSRDPRLLASLVRYVETKCLLAGVTSSQGISLRSDHLNAYYRGAMRVVEDPVEHRFPKATTHIPDIAAADWASFKRILDRSSCLLLHLSEGLDDKARAAFLSLQNGEGSWAISSALAGIHCAALQAEDFAVLANHGGGMVWSPLSNLLLYGGTANIAAARSAGVPISLGSDWSPSGSTNLLNELKVAKAVCEGNGLPLTDHDLVSMVTRAPASTVKWNSLVGSLEPGKRADLVVASAPPNVDIYAGLIAARETDIQLVVIDGRPVVGEPALMSSLSATGETLQVGGTPRIIDYGPADPKVPSVTYQEARDALTGALGRLPHLLSDEAAGRGIGQRALVSRAVPWRLALDEQQPTGLALRPRLPLDGQSTGPDAQFDRTAAIVPVKPLEPVTLDPVSVPDDPDYATTFRMVMLDWPGCGTP